MVNDSSGTLPGAQSSRHAIDVGCAIIERQGKILIAQRRHRDTLGGFWEFPGGKFDAGETLEDCLVREVREELGICIRPRRFLRTIAHDYPERRLRLHFYLCDFCCGEPSRLECLDFQWVEVEALRKFQFPPADLDILNELMTMRF